MVIRKALRIATGVGFLLIGFLLALPFVPGPGIPLMLVGLVILSDHFHWAKRLTNWVKRKFEGARDSLKPQP